MNEAVQPTFFGLELIYVISAVLGILLLLGAIAKGILGNYAYDLLAPILPFVSKDANRDGVATDGETQDQSVESSGHLSGEIDHEQDRGEQSQTQSVSIDNSDGDLSVSQSQSKGDLSEEDEDDEVVTDGGWVSDAAPTSPFLTDGGGQSQDQDVRYIDNSNIRVVVNESQENPSSDLSIKMYPKNQGDGGLPVVDEAQEEQAIPFYQFNGQVQVKVTWPSDLEYHWINIDTPDNYTVDFLEEDELCEYRNNGSMPQFRLNDGIPNSSFLIEVTADSEPIRHRLCMVSEFGETIVDWKLVPSKKYEI